MTFVILARSADAFCQAASRDRTWEIEVHLGGTASCGPRHGVSQLPEPGPVVTLPEVFGQRRITRVVPSWYFGDGAALLTQVFGQRRLPSASMSENHVGFSRVATIVDAMPLSVQRPGVGRDVYSIPAFAVPGIQFSTTSSPSTLSLTSVVHFKTFEAQGLANQLNLSAGLYFRF